MACESSDVGHFGGEGLNCQQKISSELSSACWEMLPQDGRASPSPGLWVSYEDSCPGGSTLAHGRLCEKEKEICAKSLTLGLFFLNEA